MKATFKCFTTLLFVIPTLLLGGCTPNEGFGTLMGAAIGAAVAGDNNKLAGAAIGALLGGVLGRSLDSLDENDHVAMNRSFYYAMNSPYVSHRYQYPWENENSGHYGHFTLGGSYYLRRNYLNHRHFNSYCREFRHYTTIVVNGSVKIYKSSGLACRDPYGRWGILH